MRSVLVASKDEAHVVRRGVRAALEREPGITVVGEASTGSDTLRLAEELRPDVVAAGLDYPDMPAIEVIRQLRQSRADLGIVVVTVFEDIDHVLDAIDAGADCYLLVSTPVEALVNAIRGCNPGQFTVLDPAPRSRPWLSCGDARQTRPHRYQPPSSRYSSTCPKATQTKRSRPCSAGRSAPSAPICGACTRGSG